MTKISDFVAKLNVSQYKQKATYLGDVITQLEQSGMMPANLRKTILDKLAKSSLDKEQLKEIKALDNSELKALLQYASAYQNIHETLHGKPPDGVTMDQTIAKINTRNNIVSLGAQLDVKYLHQKITALDTTLSSMQDLEIGALKKEGVSPMVSAISATLHAAHHASPVTQSKFSNPFVGVASFEPLKPPKLDTPTASAVYEQELVQYKKVVDTLKDSLSTLSTEINTKVTKMNTKIEDLELKHYITTVTNAMLTADRDMPRAELIENVSNITCQHIEKTKGLRFNADEKRNATLDIKKEFDTNQIYEKWQNSHHHQTRSFKEVLGDALSRAAHAIGIRTVRAIAPPAEEPARRWQERVQSSPTSSHER